MTNIEPGVYQHFKGRRYRVIGVARHSETEEELVVYQPLYEAEQLMWVRPAHMFNELVDSESGLVARFQLLEPSPS